MTGPIVCPPCPHCTGKGYVVQVGPDHQTAQLECRACAGTGHTGHQPPPTHQRDTPMPPPGPEAPSQVIALDERRAAPQDTGTLVYDPRDGTVYQQLTDEPTGLLAHLALELKAREQQFKQMREHVEAELTDRVQAAGRKTVLVEGLELTVKSGRGRVWHGDDLEDALRALVDAGALHAGELTGLITHKTDVDGRAALRLLGTLNGTALTMVEACFHWEQKSRPKLTITPSLALLPDQEPPAPQ